MAEGKVGVIFAWRKGLIQTHALGLAGSPLLSYDELGLNNPSIISFCMGYVTVLICTFPVWRRP